MTRMTAVARATRKVAFVVLGGEDRRTKRKVMLSLNKR